MTEGRETPKRNGPGTKPLKVVGGKEHKTETAPNKGAESNGAKKKITRRRSAPDPVTGLTEKQEAFCQAVMSGKSYSAAYREAYTTDGMADPTIWNAACKLAASPTVSARLMSLKAQKEGERRMQAVSRGDFVIAELSKMANDTSVPHAVRVRALELMGKTVALFTDRVESEDVTDKTADEIEAQIKARLGL